MFHDTHYMKFLFSTKLQIKSIKSNSQNPWGQVIIQNQGIFSGEVSYKTGQAVANSKNNKHGLSSGDRGALVLSFMFLISTQESKRKSF